MKEADPMCEPDPASRRPRPNGFTLIELMVVLLILGILAAILIPAIGSVRRSAENSSSVSRIRSLADTVLLFAADNGGRFPGNGNQFNHRWYHKVAPYFGFEADGTVEGIPVYLSAYELEGFFNCPALSGVEKPDGSGTYIARYGLNLVLQDAGGGLAGAINSNLGVRLAEVTNPARTVLLATKADGAPGLRPLPYPDHPFGVAANLRDDRNPENGANADGFMGPHAYAFVDGHVEVRDYFIGPEAFQLNVND